MPAAKQCKALADHPRSRLRGYGYRHGNDRLGYRGLGTSGSGCGNVAALNMSGMPANRSPDVLELCGPKRRGTSHAALASYPISNDLTKQHQAPARQLRVRQDRNAEIGV
jgi:hypothetical protein